MHICMIVTSYKEPGRTHTGAELQADTQLRALQALGHSITVIAKKKTKTSKFYETIDGIDIYRVWPTGFRSILTAFLLWKKRKQFDIVHLHGQHVFTALAAWVCKLLAIPTVMKITISKQVFAPTSIDKILPKKFIPFRKCINWLSRQSSAVITISQEIAAELIDCHFTPEKIQHITNGVNMSKFQPISPDEQSALRRELGLPEDKILALFCSRLIHRKGFDLIINAWPEIWKNHQDLHLVMVGDGNAEAQAHIQKLTQQTSPSAITVVGQVANSAPYMQAADIFLFPSRKEGLPNALIEAMSCGCACIASDIGGNTDLISPEKAGLLFASGDYQDFSRHLNGLLAERGNIAELGLKAASYMKTHYDIKIIAAKLEQLYQNLSSK